MSVDKSLDDKKKRKRWKKLLSDIHEQLEFYFSDANLRKDRFLSKKIESNEDGYVDISVLLSFNKLKMLTTDAELVARAIKKSSFLQVSDDNKRLRRVNPMMPSKYNIDDVTVYVECLPKTVDHSWLQKVFGSCGKVTYVSIPRYKSTGDIKGFAFIEFENPEEASKACKLLNNPPPDVTDKPGKFPKMRKGKAISIDSNPEPYRVQRQRQLMEQKLIKEERLGKKTLENEADLENKEPDGAKKSKRKRSHDEDKNVENAADTKQKKKSKKQKLEKVDKKLEEDVKVEGKERRNEDLEESDGKSFKKQKAKKRKLEDEDKVMNQKKKKSHESEKVNDDEKLKKKRKRKKNPNKLKDGCQQLRVIPKTEWLQLKKEYINLQKQSKRQLKHNIMEMELQQKTAIRACPKKDPVNEVKSKEPEFTAGTVVSIVSKESIPSRKRLREYLETMAPIAYLDLEDGDCKGFARVKTAQGASDVIDRLRVDDGMSVELLTGDEEKHYWEKLKADRIARLTNKTKGKKKRGADRLMDKAERVLTVASRSHIKFED